LNPLERARYIELVKEEYYVPDMDNTFQMKTKEQDFVNPTTEGKLSWENDIYCTSDSEEESEKCQNRLHEVSTRQCAIINKKFHCMISKVCNLPSYHVLGDVDNFLNEYEEQVPENQRFPALDISLKATPTRWWNSHKKNIDRYKD